MPRYLLLTIAYFWVPVLCMGLFLRSRLNATDKKAFWIAMAILAPMTFAMEYVYLWADVWNFSEDVDPLIGLWLWGAPIEEFSFWFGAAPFILLLYLTLDWFFKKQHVDA